MATPKEVRAWFLAQGLTIAQWAAAHGFKAEHVYAALSGRTAGRRGRAHHVAIALGLKPSPRDLVPPAAVLTHADDDRRSLRSPDNRTNQETET